MSRWEKRSVFSFRSLQNILNYIPILSLCFLRLNVDILQDFSMQGKLLDSCDKNEFNQLKNFNQFRGTLKSLRSSRHTLNTIMQWHVGKRGPCFLLAVFKTFWTIFQFFCFSSYCVYFSSFECWHFEVIFDTKEISAKNNFIQLNESSLEVKDPAVISPKLLPQVQEQTRRGFYAFLSKMTLAN